MKIVFFVGSFKLGGTEKVSILVGRELLKRGYDVHYILLNSTDDYQDPMVRNRVESLKGETVSSVFKPLILLYRLRRQLRKINPDRVVSFSKGLNLLLTLTFHKHIVYTIESNMFIYTRKLYRRYMQKYGAMLPQVKKVIVPSDGLYNACKEYFRDGSKLESIPNPCDVQEDTNLEIPGEFIVSAGRLVRSKGFDELIRTYSRSNLVGIFKLVILGEGPERPHLEKIIKDLNISEYVEIAGFTTDPYSYFRQAHFFVLNTFHESFGNVLVEAMASGAPVICRNCDYGPRDIIEHGVSGFLYENTDQLKMYMERLAADNRLRKDMSEQAKRQSAEYEIGPVTDQWEKKVLS